MKKHRTHMSRIIAAFTAVILTLQGGLANFTPVHADSISVPASTEKPSGAAWYGDDYYDDTSDTVCKDLTFEYDSYGRLYDDGRSIYFYDGNNHPIYANEDLVLDYTGGIYVGYERDRCENVTVEASYNDFGSPTEVHIYADDYESFNGIFSYDADGNVAKIEQTGIAAPCITTFEYDSEGRLIRRIYEPEAEQGQGCETEYIYDGDLLTGLKYNMYYMTNKADPWVRMDLTLVYNERNQLTNTIETVRSTGEVMDQNWYTYDDEGRLIEKKIYHIGEMEEIEEWYYNYDGTTGEETGDTEEINQETSEDTAAPVSYSLSQKHEGKYVKNLSCGTIFETDKMYGGEILTIEWSDSIASINRDASFAIEDTETGEVIFPTSDTNTSLKITYYNNLLQCALPSSNILNFQAGRTYAVKMDPEFLTFASGKTCSGINSSNTLYISIIDHSKDTEFTFHYTSTGFTNQDGSYVKSQVNREDTCYFSESLFENSGKVYNSKLATTSLCLAMAAYNYLDYEKGYQNVEELLNTMHFSNVWHNSDYENKPKTSSTGVEIGEKALEDGSTLIAVVVRGGNYTAEWAGNFDVGASGTNHAGFDTGKYNVLNALKAYLTGSSSRGSQISGRIKIWIVGYSRGSAIANLTAAALDDMIAESSYSNYLGTRVTLSSDDVYAYCFETPASTTDSNAHSERYQNIYCIINPSDVVPYIPLEEWGFRRYGTDLYLPETGTADYNSYIGTVKSSFNKIFPNLTKIQMNGMPFRLQYLIYLLGERVETRQEYVDELQYNAYSFLAEANDAGSNGYIDLGASIMTVIYGTELDDGESVTENLIIASLNSVDGEFFTGYALGLYQQNAAAKASQGEYPILIPHYAELTLAWMRALESQGVLDSSLPADRQDPTCSETADALSFSLNKVSFHCPVNVTMYDNEGNVLAALQDQYAYISEEYPEIQAYYEYDGTMTFVVPTEAEYSFEVEPYDDGTMTVTVEATDADTDIAARYVTFDEVNVFTGQTLMLDVDTGYEGSDFTANMTDSNGETVSYTEETDVSVISETDRMMAEIEAYAASAESDEAETTETVPEETEEKSQHKVSAVTVVLIIVAAVIFLQAAGAAAAVIIVFIRKRKRKK